VQIVGLRELGHAAGMLIAQSALALPAARNPATLRQVLRIIDYSPCGFMHRNAVFCQPSISTGYTYTTCVYSTQYR
jgi:hypothetical protein